MTFTLAELSQKLAVPFKGDGACVVTRIAPLASANTGAITFCDKGKYRQQLLTSQASVVILAKEDSEFCNTNQLITAQPYLIFAKVAECFSTAQPTKTGIHPSAIIGEHCQIANTAYIGPYVVIENNVHIGDHTAIHAHTFIGQNCKIGAYCTLWPRVTLYPEVHIGDKSTVHSHTVIGGDGFGYSPSPEGWHKIPQLGSVRIGNQVEIGSNTTIDRGTLEATVIEDGVKLDNLIQVAHNVKIGQNTVIAGCTGISGSTVIGKNCIIAGGVCIADHLHIADGTTITGMAMVTKSITEAGLYSSGTGLLPNLAWRKNAARFRHLNELALKIRDLEAKLNTLVLEEVPRESD